MYTCINVYLQRNMTFSAGAFFWPPVFIILNTKPCWAASKPTPDHCEDCEDSKRHSGRPSAIATDFSITLCVTEEEEEEEDCSTPKTAATENPVGLSCSAYSFCGWIRTSGYRCTA